MFHDKTSKFSKILKSKLLALKMAKLGKVSDDGGFKHIFKV